MKEAQLIEMNAPTLHKALVLLGKCSKIRPVVIDTGDESYLWCAKDYQVLDKVH